MIELMTDLRMIRDENTINVGNFAHDALAAHAYGLAIGEARLKWRVQSGQYAWVSDRASAILAELLAGKGEV